MVVTPLPLDTVNCVNTRKVTENGVAVVSKVTENGLADQAGIEAGEVISAINHIVVDGKSHREVVVMLANAGLEVIVELRKHFFNRRKVDGETMEGGAMLVFRHGFCCGRVSPSALKWCGAFFSTGFCARGCH
jgi:S1-C subfamily serine protease